MYVNIAYVLQCHMHIYVYIPHICSTYMYKCKHMCMYKYICHVLFFLIHTSIGSCTVFGFLIRLLKVSVIKRFMANYSQNS